MDDMGVRVAVRIRPQSAKERIDMCQICTNVTPDEPQIVLGKDKAFTFDYVFNIDSIQDQVYNTCAHTLIEGCFEGYNATIFAYGQTGAGKTYTMGTGFDVNQAQDMVGIIPRAVEHLFSGIEERKNAAAEKGLPAPEFKVNAQFMELYNEEILDLLDTTRDPAESRGRKSLIKIHEDASGSIYTVGVTTRIVASVQDTIQCLKIGALSRTTASTNMNSSSSRSHAIFTLHIKQQRVVQEEQPVEGEEGEIKQELINEFETLTAKFHFVDLAGSERLKRTGATGERAKEGISINCGLLALGNVISALGDKAKKGCHVPYRDSKLTRLLQDSLGGNSRTTMIACVSPSDRDFMETMNTLKYANRARNIKNKITVNQDQTSKQIAALRMELLQLQQELYEYKTGKRVVDEDGVESINDMFHENTMLQTETNKLRQRIKAMQETIDTITNRNIELLAEREKLDLSNIPSENVNDEISNIIKRHIRVEEELRAKLTEAEAEIDVVRRTAARGPTRASMSPMAVAMTGPDIDFGLTSPTGNIDDILALARMDLKKDRDVAKKKQKPRTQSQGSDKENVSEDEKQDHEDLESPDKDDQDEDQDEDIEEAEEGMDEEGGEEELEELLSDSDDEEDTDSVKNPDNIHEDLAKLTCEISIKQKLIEELENSQKQLQNMKSHYEHKLMSLQSRIQETEIERDKVLTDMATKKSDSKEAVTKVKAEYERKLSGMTTEMKKMQAAVKEHAKHIKNQAANEKRLRQIQQELNDMKKNKVKLMQKMKDESTRNRKSEMASSKQIAQLKKEQRARDNQIRTLEAEKRQKALVLKRKHEEVLALRQRQRPMSAAAAGRVAKYTKPVTKPVSKVGSYRTKRFSPKAAKQRWDNLEKKMASMVTKKQMINHMEKDMDRWVKEREKVGKRIEKFHRRKEKAVAENKGESAIRDLDDQIETLKANIDYIQENIQECQSSIVQMEENSKDDDDLTPLLNVSNLDEANYLLEHLLSWSLSQRLQATQKEAENHELTQKLNHQKQNNTYQQEILQYLIRDHVDIEIDGSLVDGEEDTDTGSQSSSRSVSPVDSLECGSPALPSPVEAITGMVTSTPVLSNSAKAKEKARRRTALPEDLLYAGATPVEPAKPVMPPPVMPPLAPASPKPEVTFTVNGGGAGTQPEAFLMPPPKAPPAGASKIPSSRTNGTSAPPATSAAGGKKPAGKVEPSPQMRRKLNLPISSASAGPKPRSHSDTKEATPPSSPTSSRRSYEENVFHRLTSNTQSPKNNVHRGVISQTSSKMQKPGPLVHTHSATGHTKAVLSVYAVEDLMFSSSKDRTAKVWDLEQGREILSLGGHPNNVVVTKYSEYTQLVFTVSTYVIKVWDLRQGAKCIQSLTAGGMTNEGELITDTTSRQVSCPPGETIINDIAVSSTGRVLYSASGSSVRIWDLRSYKPVGKMAGGHQSAVMVLAVDDTDTADGNICVVTGSKDHYIKVFEVSEDTVGLASPKYNLEPPHYDGIQSLCLMGDLLFSGSRDKSIKKWDLADQQLKHSINGAHKDWVCGLTFVPNSACLLSGCRSGYMKLWNIDSCSQVAEIRAHDKPINCVSTNSSLVFTASDDRTVRIWTPQGADLDSDFD